MSISGALNNAVSGLTANARMAEVVSSNLSNVLTDGYGRRSVNLSSVQVGDVGGGVRIDGINRFVDAGILADRRLADASLSGQERSADMLQRLQQTLGDAVDGTNIVSRLAALESALITAGSDPSAQVRLDNVVNRLRDVTETLQANTKATQGLRQEADAAIARDIDVLNSSLAQVATLNRDILRVSGSARDPSALMDARQRAVDQIAELVPVRAITRDNGTIGLMTTNGVTLLDSKPVVFGFQPTPTITGDMTIASGALGGVTVDGQPLDPATGIGRLDGGALGSAFAMRDQTLVDVQSGLDGLAADLIARFQDPTTDPTLPVGGLGLLTDEGGVLDPADLAGLAGRININAAVDPRVGGNAVLIRDGLNAAAPSAVGDPTQINRWIAALDTARADIAGTALRSAEGRASQFVSQLGATRLAADDALSLSSARWETLREAELADGVDTDVELQTLLRVEQAYAANAKVIETVDFMMQRLMEI